MSIWEAIIFGIVEGVTEFLPVSSTGHLILTAQILKSTQTEFLKSFEIIIQLGAMLSIVVLYGKSLLRSVEVWKRIMIAFIPTGLIGFLLYKFVKSVLLENHHIVLWALFLGGLFLVIFDSLHKEDKTSVDEIVKMPYRTAVMIGVFQSVAMVPGVSRSAATIIGGLICGLKRKTIVEFSFLLALPTMTATTGLDLLQNAQSFTTGEFVVLGVGFVVSFLVAILSVKFLIRFIQQNNFISFGIYRMLLPVFWWIFGK